MSEPMPLIRPGPWTLDDLDRLPDDGQRHEIIDGILLVSPPPTPRHQAVADVVHALLRAAAPEDVAVVEAAGVRAGASVLVPDLLVARTTAVWDPAAKLLSPTDVLLVVEIVSPSSMTTDRVTKPALYAAAGIPHYWRVDPDGPTVVVHRLAGATYAEEITIRAADTRAVGQPFPVTVVPAQLVSAR